MLCAFPIEIANRELPGMLYLALNLAKAGHPSLIGERMVERYVRASNQPVCYFDSDQHHPTNRHVLDNGGVVFNVDAEGLSMLERPESDAIRFGEVVNHVTRICMWGKAQKEMLQRLLPEDKHHRLTVTGYPSFDLLREEFIPMYRDQSIVDKYGEDYILLNTNYASFNHAMGCDNYIKMLMKMDEWKKVYGTDEYREFIRETCDYQEQMITETITLLQHLSRTFPERIIIVRPHPIESCEYYTSRLENCGNIIVTNEKDVRPWLASASVVIHHDCTTGMEALMLGKPVIQYRPVLNPKVTSSLMVEVGIKAYSPAEVADLIQEASEASQGLTDQLKQHLSPQVANLEMKATSRLVDLVEDCATDIPAWIPRPLGLVGQAKCWRKYISKLIRQYQPGKTGQKVKYALSKFPRVSQKEILNKLNGFRQIEPDLPEVTVEQLCLNTFLIQAKS